VNKRVVNHIELEERLPVSPTGGRAGEKMIPKFDLGRLLEYVDTLGLNSQRIDFTHSPFKIHIYIYNASSKLIFPGPIASWYI